MSETLIRIVEELKALDEAERHQLQSILSHLNEGAVPAPELVLERQLAAEGLLSLPTPGTSTLPLAALILPQGRPLSEILLEERR